MICTNDFNFCKNFISDYPFDKSFLYKADLTDLKNIISKQQVFFSYGYINSIFAIEKINYQNSKELMMKARENLINSGYIPVFQSPAVDVLICRNCVGNKKYLENIENFKELTEIQTLATKTVVQESVQGFSTDKKKSEKEDISRFLVGVFKEIPSLEKVEDKKLFQISLKETQFIKDGFNLNQIDLKVHGKKATKLTKLDHIFLCSVHEDDLASFKQVSENENNLVLSIQSGIKINKGNLIKKAFHKKTQQPHHFFLIASSIANDLSAKTFCKKITYKNGIDQTYFTIMINEKTKENCISGDDEFSKTKAEILLKNNWKLLSSEEAELKKQEGRKCQIDIYIKDNSIIPAQTEQKPM